MLLLKPRFSHDHFNWSTILVQSVSYWFSIGLITIDSKDIIFTIAFFNLQMSDIEVLRHLVENPASDVCEFTVNAQGTDGVTATLGIRASKARIADETLTLFKGNFRSKVHPADDYSTWGPVPLPGLPPEVKNNCHVATHA